MSASAVAVAAAEVSGQGEGDAVAEQEFVVFELDGHSFALPLDLVDEIIRIPSVTPVPLSPPALKGLMNLRGRVVPVADLRTCCGLPDGTPDEDARVLVTELDPPLGFLVDRVLGIRQGTEIHADDETLSTATDGVAVPEGSRILRGVLQSELGIVVVIDLPAVVLASLGTGRTVRTGGTSSPRAAPDRLAGVVADDAPTHELVSFTCSGQEFAFRLDQVREIVRAPQTPVPLPRTADSIVGLTELRGQVLPLVNLSTVLGLDGSGDESWVVVVALEDGDLTTTVGLITDGVREVLTVQDAHVRPLPATFADDAGVGSVCMLQDGQRMVSLLDVEEILRGLHTGLAAVPRPRAETDDEETTMAEPQEGDELQLVTFRLSGENYAVAVEDISEIVRHTAASVSLPDAPAYVAGLCNLRGAVLPLIDLRIRLGAAVAPYDESTRIIVTTAHSSSTGLVVDAVSDVRRVPRSSVQPPDGLAAGRADFVIGVINDQANDELHLLLDLELLLAGIDTDLAAVRAS